MSAIYKNGSWYGKDAVPEGVTLTQTEFDALPQSEKDNGTVYYIEDGDYLVNKATMGYTPIGTIISVMGNSAPRHYLACDGQIVNIVDYPELANYFEQQFGTKNNFGGDGETTFAVPDLRGEFLRGAGTNSHSGQGNGASVGTHQNATRIPSAVAAKSGNGTPTLGMDAISEPTSGGTYNTLNNPDSYETRVGRVYVSGTFASATDGTVARYTVKPTNTSVLFCIATKNIYTNPENIYSTDEIVVGQWIDGKPLYQKTIIITDFSAINTSTRTWYTLYTSDDSAYDFCFIIDNIMYYEDNNTKWTITLNEYLLDSSSPPSYSILRSWVDSYNKFNVQVCNSGSTPLRAGTYTNKKLYVTVQYTKTTD